MLQSCPADGGEKVPAAALSGVQNLFNRASPRGRVAGAKRA